MSLARTLMNGGYPSMGSIDASRYGHQCGASRIAMESTEELHDIFMESFYNIEQIEISAAVEGVEVPGSRFEAIYEATSANVFTKIKEFFSKLWNKIKAFFHEVKRYIDSIFMSGKEFVTKYKKDIEAIKTLKDFEFKMFKYNDAEIDEIKTAPEYDESDFAALKTLLDANKNATGDAIDRAVTVIEDAIQDPTTGWNDKSKAAWLKKEYNSTEDDIDETLFGMFRDKATDESDKEDVEVTSVKEYMNTLINSKVGSKFSSYQSKMDKYYSSIIKGVEKLGDEITKDSAVKDKTKLVSAIRKAVSEYTSYISYCQTYKNKYVSAWKTAYKERDAAYKALIMAAFAYAKKNNK